ncbi:MAG: hypothetical protein UY17_C0022G0004 [Candidatus Beckwithbacteria bacterium GW2011_GWC2_47_9]|uniref:Putative pre-16S rRNA nuclease n=1 Tax=Candidatus Beckwithbacteria bacterium GW2011_GWC2_47_9 TaxID=1618373 RepID=A0A0G1WYJ1_9BACT|nr:MAG: hypothetical protein UX94_C0011G0004 [Parcubacteria group bacterium GW2011_GWA2_47_21]KKU87290.1 MAG: hypothetical protein UY17_C0022G0004 [Candidatus Beckwithbacteria bacterium GW2011_GWC2_47_9]
MRYLGIDYGGKRVGVAISDQSGKIAFPEGVIPNTKHLAETVKIICEEKSVGEIVLGESKNFSGEDNPVMKKIYEFKAALAKETNLPIRMEPEFLTSAEAERIQGKNKMHDASAAALILQSFLDKRRSAAL